MTRVQQIEDDIPLHANQFSGTSFVDIITKLSVQHLGKHRRYTKTNPDP